MIALFHHTPTENMSCETECTCCNSESMPTSQQINSLATAGFAYLQQVTTHQSINTWFVIERFLNNLPEDKQH